MSLPRFLVTELPLTGPVALSAEEARHASQVLRLSAGASIELFDGRGGAATGVIVSANKRGTEVEISHRLDVDRELPGFIELLIALPKGDRQKQLVEGLVQLGVHRLTPLTTHRSVAQPVANALERLQRAVVEASKQCGRNRLLEIGTPVALESCLESPAPQSQARYFAHPYGAAANTDSIGLAQSTQIIIGPEGGLTESEAGWLASAGWRQIALGPRILRVEMAAFAVTCWWSQQIESQRRI